MNMKTATLIALIGISIRFVLGVVYSVIGFGNLFRNARYLYMVYYVLSSILLHGSIILFLAVFYSQQKDLPEPGIGNLQ